ncbi:hypothetical protein BSL78_07925 [Apostichopus japonicus]|uniref:SPRY domain-containing protein n=1 Tax=Stichopus japonicus TaxID=307972 RepID=A0A2G8L4R3_STIJA|nr:hypothetical protein BSL78_07925 [Apostichopus japonicus]
MDDWLNSSVEIEVTEDGSILKIPDLALKSRHIVFSHSQKRPLTVNQPCFEVKIVQQAKDACLGLGICKECYLDAKAMKDDEFEETAADKKPDAVAYFSDDGTVSSTAKGVPSDHLPTYGQGDTITFYLDYHTPEKSLIGILKNGQLICRRWVTLNAEYVLPTVNVWWGPTELKVRWRSELTYFPSPGDLEHWRVPDTVTIKDNILLMRNSHKTTTVQSPVCFNDDFRYYEAKLISMGENGGKGPVIGISSATYKQSEYPGSSYESVGLVASEGCMYQDKRVHGAKKDARPCSEGDTVGCGILYVEAAGTCRRKDQKVVVFFTKNGEIIKHGVFTQSPGGYFPAIGLESSGCSVEVSTSCSVPPLPDSEAWLKKANSASGGLMLNFDIPEPSGPKHEDGLKEGCYRFSDLIGPPKDDVITPKKKIDNKTGKMLQYLSPLTPEMPLFTLEIIDGDDSGHVCIGVSRNEQSVGSMPGALVESVGYISSGEILMGANGEVEAQAYKQGDIIGCYIEYFDSVKCVQFIKNGQLVGTAQVKGSDTDLYPSVGFAGNPTTVRLKWQHTKPQLPPVYSQENLSTWLCSSGLKLSGDTLSVAKKNRKWEGLWFTSPQPLSKDWSYFEVTVQNELLPTPNQIVPKAPWIGITNNLAHPRFKKLRKRPDARIASYLCNLNGVAFVNSFKQNIDFQLTNVKKGDRLGFGVWYPEDISQSEARKQQVVVAYICLNGTCFWWQAFDQLSGGLYPFISLYRYGDVVTISHQCPPPDLEHKAWEIEVEALKNKLHEQKKLGQKETASSRRNRPASSVARKENSLNQYKIYIHCDVTRYNEATYIQARLNSKGFTTTLSDKDLLHNPIPEPAIQTHGCLVVCIGPEGAGSARIQNAIEEARERGTPVIPVILESMQWPPPGPLEKELSLLTMDRIEMQTDFYWGCDQIGELIQRLNDKGYNGQAVKVNTSKGATQLYTDAQKGQMTTNEKSDPNALKIAVKDADKTKQMQGFGSEDDRPSSSKEISRQTKADHPKSGRSSAKSKSSQGSSKACVIL